MSAQVGTTVSDSELAEAERKVLTMLELSAQIAEGLAGGLETPVPEGTASVAADAARFVELSSEIKETLSRAEFAPEQPYQRTADAEVFRHRVDEMYESAADELHEALRAQVYSAVTYGPQPGDAPDRDVAEGDDAEKHLAKAEVLIGLCEESAATAAVASPGPLT